MSKNKGGSGGMVGLWCFYRKSARKMPPFKVAYELP